MQNNIKKVRVEEQISQKELAKKLNVSQQAVSYMENHNVNIPQQRMVEISKILNRKVVVIFPEVKELIS